jgi:pimeloyl-ACP methyl ester carboxylesterase
VDYTGPLHVVFVHGLFSSPETWAPMASALAQDQDIAHRVRVDLFSYSSPKVQFNPLRRIPNLNSIASTLDVYLNSSIPADEPIILVGHSQGGLVIQKYMVDLLRDGRGLELQRVQGVALYATPNSGSEFFLTTRRAFGGWLNHPQEKELRPFVESLADTHRQFVKFVVFARASGTHEYAVPIYAFGGAEDAVVSPASAKSVFPNGGILPGTHTSIIRPQDAEDSRYRVLRNIIAETLTKLGADSTSEASIETLIPIEAIADAPMSPPAVTSDSGKARVVRALLEIEEFRDESARREIIRFLPSYVADDIRAGQSARIALMSVVSACDRFGQAGRAALLETLEVACPSQDPRVRFAIDVVCEVWGLDPLAHLGPSNS